MAATDEAGLRHYLVSRENRRTRIACEPGEVSDAEDCFEAGAFVRADGKRVVIEESRVTCPRCRESELYTRCAPSTPLEVSRSKLKKIRHRITRALRKMRGEAALSPKNRHKIYAIGRRGIIEDGWSDADLEHEIDVFVTSIVEPEHDSKIRSDS
jgi:hypothetical protein